MRELATALSGDGFLVFTNDLIRTEGNVADQIQVALRASSHLILMIGETLSKSQQSELETFLAETVARDTDSRVVVILTREQLNPPSRGLSQYQQLDWTTGVRTAAQVELALSLRWRGDVTQWVATLAERENSLGPNHPAIVATRTNLAEAYREAGRPDEAVALYQRTLADQLRELGADHPDTLATRHQIALQMAARGDHAGAEAEFRDVLAAQLRVLGATTRTR